MTQSKKQTNEQRQLSKFMSLLLRHQSEKFGLTLNSEGYVTLDKFLDVINRENRWKHIVLSDVEEVVATCEKQRYEIENGAIRARYGHSKGTVDYKEGTPPTILFHGTNQKALESIIKTGIKKMNRNYVHLSEGKGFATLAGQRRGDLVLLKIDTTSAAKQGVKFFYAGNEVWLSTDIPVNCIVKDN